MTAQEIFDKVSTHLLKQGERSRLTAPNKGICAYRGDNGTKCAIGCLIPDATYEYRMEGKTVVDLLDTFPNMYDIFPIDQLPLLTSLQVVHDRENIQRWAEALRIVAQRYGLTFKEETK